GPPEHKSLTVSSPPISRIVGPTLKRGPPSTPFSASKSSLSLLREAQGNWQVQGDMEIYSVPTEFSSSLVQELLWWGIVRNLYQRGHRRTGGGPGQGEAGLGPAVEAISWPLRHFFFPSLQSFLLQSNQTAVIFLYLQVASHKFLPHTLCFWELSDR